MTAPLLFAESELLEIIHDLDARANYARSRAEKRGPMRVREHASGVALGTSDAVKRIRELIESKRPKLAVRLVVRPMSEPRDLALVRNALALLRFVDRHEIEPISDRDWTLFQHNPWRAFLKLDDGCRERAWASLQRQLPADLREDTADQREQERLREFVRPDCPRCGGAVARVEPTNPAAGTRASVSYACGCVYADEDLDALVLPMERVVEGVGG